MAILELVVTGEFFGQEIINRFHYIGSGTPAAVTPSFGLVAATGFLVADGSPAAFDADTLAWYWQNHVSQDYRFISAYARNLYSETDFYERPYIASVVGGQTSESMSPAMAWGFFSNRVRTDVRRGMKRFVGVVESLVAPGGLLTNSARTAFEGWAGAMSDTLTYDDEGNTLTYVPAVLSFEEYETPRGKRAYRKYADPAVQLSHAAVGVSWAAYPQVRTQNSRQYGRGA